MKTEEQNYADLLITATRIDTTRESNGYPAGLKVAYTADTMGELRELRDAAAAAGHEVEVIRLHRQDGWALWARSNGGGLEDEAYMGRSEQDTVITLNSDSHAEAEAFDLICGEGFILEDEKGLFRTAAAVRNLADELPDTSDLEEGEKIHVFVDMNNACVDYAIRTGQNGYAHDTHQYCTALLIKEREEEEEDED
jgi:hypothetical protein